MRRYPQSCLVGPRKNPTAVVIMKRTDAAGHVEPYWGYFTSYDEAWKALRTLYIRRHRTKSAGEKAFHRDRTSGMYHLHGMQASEDELPELLAQRRGPPPPHSNPSRKNPYAYRLGVNYGAGDNSSRLAKLLESGTLYKTADAAWDHAKNRYIHALATAGVSASDAELEFNGFVKAGIIDVEPAWVDSSKWTKLVRGFKPKVLPNPWYVTDKSGTIYSDTYDDDDNIADAWRTCKELDKLHPELAPFTPQHSASEGLRKGDIIKDRVKHIGPTMAIEPYVPPEQPKYRSVRPYKWKGGSDPRGPIEPPGPPPIQKPKPKGPELRQENPYLYEVVATVGNDKVVYLSGFRTPEAAQKAADKLNKTYNTVEFHVDSRWHHPENVRDFERTNTPTVPPDEEDDDMEDEVPGGSQFKKPNPFMKGRPALWYPKKGSEAAKDIGSILQKMRKATEEEKAKLKTLMKETRAKWMAREKKSTGSAPPLARSSSPADGPTERGSSAKKNPDNFDSASKKALERNRYGLRMEVAKEDGYKVTWSNGQKVWGRWPRRVTKGEEVQLDANEILLYGKARDVDALAETLPFPPVYRASTEARDRGDEHEGLDKPWTNPRKNATAYRIVDSDGHEFIIGYKTKDRARDDLRSMATDMLMNDMGMTREEAEKRAVQYASDSGFRVVPYWVDSKDWDKETGMRTGADGSKMPNPGLLGQIAAGVAANVVTGALRKNPWYITNRAGRILAAEMFRTPQDAARWFAQHHDPLLSPAPGDVEVRYGKHRLKLHELLTDWKGLPMTPAYVAEGQLAEGFPPGSVNPSRMNPWYITDQSGRMLYTRGFDSKWDARKWISMSDDPNARKFRKKWKGRTIEIRYADDTLDKQDPSMSLGRPTVSGGEIQYPDFLLENPWFLTDPKGNVLDARRFRSETVMSAKEMLKEATAQWPKLKYDIRLGDVNVRSGDIITEDGQVIAKTRRKNPGSGAVKLPPRLERQVMSAPAGDRPELLKGLTKYYEFHGCFPPRIETKDVDHAKLGYPKVGVALGQSSKIDYQTSHPESSKFFAGGKGRYEHKFGEGLKDASRAKPTLITDPTGTTLHLLPSLFRVKDWIHH